MSAKKEAEDEQKLKMSEKDQVIESLANKIEALKRSADQGSQQLQGEVQELELEGFLKMQFPIDTIEPIAKGQSGGDILQHILNAQGQVVGKILWETKRTKTWSDSWIQKLKEDQRAAKTRAEISVIVTHTLPKTLETL